MAENRFTPKKRRALDGRIWWCIYDNRRNAWSTFLYHGKYTTRKAALYAIQAGKTMEQ